MKMTYTDNGLFPELNLKHPNAVDAVLLKICN